MAKIFGKIFFYLVNDSKTENIITSEFFLPFFEKKSRIFLGGTGQHCNLKSFICKSLIKSRDNFDDGGNIFSNDKRNCDCCLII